MKKILSTLLSVLTGAAILVSCEKIQKAPDRPAATDESATLTVALAGVDIDISTRASSTAEHGGDKTASITKFLIFDSAGNFLKSLDAAGEVKLSKGMKYTVAAVVNGPSVSGNLTAVRGTVADLKDNPFVMYGEKEADLTTANSATAEVAVTSLASRIYLKSITNSLPPAFGAIKLKQVHLCNVVGQNKLDGTAVTTTWYNQYGRKTLGTKITANSLTGAVDASTPASTSTLAAFSDYSIANAANYSANSYFYAFPNAVKTDIPSDIATKTTWEAQATWLTVCGEVSGKLYYWTANLGAKLTSGLERNKSYDVSLTINNIGSSDPGTPVTEADAALSVKVNPWVAGQEINATI